MQTVSDHMQCSSAVDGAAVTIFKKRPHTPKRLSDVLIMDGGVTAIRLFTISDSGCTLITWLTFEFQQDKY